MSIKANFSAYSTYVTDSLNQWDLNQVLQVTGLNLTGAPEVHFSNANTDRAIVRQSTMTNHVVSVAIPNSLLQDPLRIFAHIGVYEGSTFKVVELVEIPVTARKRPLDYQIEDTDEEVYSFKRLENLLANAATKDQVANIVASVTTDSELIDVRYGADGVTYASAGEAVREQLDDVGASVEQLASGHLPFGSILKNYYIHTGDGVLTAYDGWDTTDFIVIAAGANTIRVASPLRASASNAFYDSDKNLIETFTIAAGETLVTVPENAAYFRLSNEREALKSASVTSASTEKLDDLAERVEAVEAAAEVVGGMNVAEYFTDEVLETVTSIESSASDVSLVLTLVADPHLAIDDADRVRRTKNTFKNIKAVSDKTFSDGLIILGDFVKSDDADVTQEKTDETIRTVMEYGRQANATLYGIDGNHDGVGGSVPQSTNYATMKRLNEGYVVRENAAPYFYRDYDHVKVRCIFLATNIRVDDADVWGVDDTQLAWFSQTLKTAPTDYDVAVFSHIATFDTQDFKTNRDECCAILNEWIAHSGEYAEATGRCIGWYAGHEHLDLIVPTSSSGVNCPQVVTQCAHLSGWTPSASDSYIYSLSWVNNAREDLTVTEDCWSTLVYNRSTSKVHIIRFGAGNDMEIDLADYE